MDFNFKNIITNIFGKKSEDFRDKKLSQLKEYRNHLSEKITFLNNSKLEIIKAFDSLNDKTVDELEKASQIEEKSSISRRLARYEDNFLREQQELSIELNKATEELMDVEKSIFAELTPNDKDYELYKWKVMGTIEQKNYFANLNFDVNVNELSFDAICTIISKAIDEGVLDQKDERPYVISENDYYTAVIDLAKAIEAGQLSEDMIEKGRVNVSQLQKKRVQVVDRNGRIYTKTVYYKLEEKAPEKAASYTQQQDFEQRMKIGDKIVANFKGWNSGTKFEGVKGLEIKEIHDDHIVAKFTEDWRSPTGYTYGPNASNPEGKEIKLPRISKKSWSQAERFVEYVDPELERIRRREEESADLTRVQRDKERLAKTHHLGDAQSPAAATQEITHSDQVQNGDVVQFTKDGESVRGVVRSMWRQDGGVARLTIEMEDGSMVYKKIPTRRGGAVEKVAVGQTVVTNEDGVPVIKDPTQMTEETLKQLENAVSTVRYPNGTAWMAEFNRHFPNMDTVTMMRDLKAEIKDIGIRNIRTQIIFKLDGSFDFEISGMRGFKMERKFQITTAQGGPGTSVYHAYFKVSDDDQGSGIGKKLFRILNKQYRRAGIKELRVSANITSGAYAWGRYGFTANKRTAESKTQVFKQWIGQTRKLPNGQDYTVTEADYQEAKKRVDKFYQHNPATTRFPMNDLMTVNGGRPAKLLMISNSWDGVLNLTDLKQRDHFEGYIQY